MRAHRSERRWLRWAPFAVLSFGPVALLAAESLSGGAGRALREALVGARGLELLLHTVAVGAGVVALASALGVPFGFLVSRTDLRGRSLYAMLALAPLLIPPFVAGIAWTRIAPIGGYDAIVGLLGSCLWPIPAFFASQGFRSASEEAEDAARLAGGERMALWRVTLPLARGEILAAALLIFVLAISDFTVPDFFSFAGVQEGSFHVFATDVYFRWTEQDAAGAFGAALPLIALAVLAVLILARLEGRRDLASVTGHHRPPRPYRLGRLAPLGHGFAAGVLLVTAGVPLAVFFEWIWEAQAPAAALPEGLGGPAVHPLVDAFQRGAGDLGRSLGYSILAALGVLAVAAGPAFGLARRKTSPGRALALVLVPLAVPSLLLGMAQIRTFNRPWPGFTGFYEGGGLVVLALACRFLPIGVLGLRSYWLRIHSEILDSTELFVPGGARRLWRVNLPLLLPGLATALAVVFGLCMRELDAVVLLDGAQKTLPLRIFNQVHYARDAQVALWCLLQLGAVFLPLALGRWVLLPALKKSRAGR